MGKKLIKRALIGTGAALFLVGILAIFFLYQIRWKGTEAGKAQREAGRHQVTFQMIGEPEWPFGRTKIRALVRDTQKSKADQEINTYIHNGGGAFREGNWKVEWQGDAVEITLMGSEQADEVFPLALQKS